MTQRLQISAALAAMLVVASLLSAQQPAVQSDPRTMLTSADWTVRMKAFDALNARSNAWSEPGMAGALEHLFERENRMIAATLRESGGTVGVSDKYGEGFTYYYSSLFNACLARCDRGDFLTVLLGDAVRGSPVREHTLEVLGMNVMRFNAEQRGKIDEALAQAAGDSTNEFVRDAALRAIGEVVRRDAALGSSQRARLHQAVVGAAEDRRLMIRLTVVRRLADFGEPGDVALLQCMASQDTLQRVSAGRVTYPVRDEANRALARARKP
jgi:hypothetical protein